MISIVVPAYNEENRIGRMLDAYLPYFCGKCGDGVELIVAVNGSTDGTAELCEGYRAKWPALRVLIEPRPIGKGGAVMMGMDAARGDLIGFVDADGATPPAAFADLVDHIGDAGIILANRWHPDSRITPQPRSRRIASRLFNTLVRLLFRIHTRDTQCGAKVMSRRALEAVRPRLGVTQWAFDVDLLFQVRRAGFAIKDVPTVWNDVAGSRIRIVRASLEMLVAIVRLRLLHSGLRWTVRWYDATVGRFVHRHD